MGNGVGKLTLCFTGTDIVHRRKDVAVYISDPLDDLGHSFCYVRPAQSRISSSKVHSAEETTTFRSISGASVSANTSTPLSTSFLDVYSYNTIDKASAFESSTSFASIPLQPLPRNSINSGPLPSGPYSGPIERGFLSGPIERGFQSGPLFSGPLEKGNHDQFQRSYSHGGFAFKRRSRKRHLIRVIQRAISRTFTTRGQNSTVAPITKNVGHLKDHNWIVGSSEKNNELTISSVNLSSEGSFFDDDECMNQNQNLQWAQGKAGEDRVHVVVSEEHGWVFVGIYDGFNGPDAPDYLWSNMYAAVHKELKGLLWDDQIDSSNSTSLVKSSDVVESHLDDQPSKNGLPSCVHQQESYPCATEDLETNSRNKRSRIRNRGAAKKWEENQRRWKCEFDRERLELDRRLREQMNPNGSNSINHSDVLKALSQGLKKTEESYLDIADQMLVENPELALMGSCVLVMLMKGEDVYVMNVGDSRAVLGQKSEPDLWRQDLEKINEETWYDLEVFDADIATTNPSLTACQLSMDHSTSIDEEVERIKNEHPDDAWAVMNDRVKGSLKVTRAFGADGLYQYFTNEEAVSEVELFIQWSPEGDPAQHLVEEVLLRIDFHELLEIPQGDRRRYHDDVSVIVISLEGRIWRSCL
ncbi:Protein phosphatase 2C [Cynara cardunculus var. scolymus]|uniref:Protein phosphatase 2C n=1 Tax=Cynara cardunculus var. scolymus TaxID=59895 RepID=A0A103YMQ6_CYNCS|nr:Protein phosphatase 2C [Cynara cardunculus var. scolymus]